MNPKQVPRRAHPRDVTSSEHCSRERAECSGRSRAQQSLAGISALAVEPWASPARTPSTESASIAPTPTPPPGTHRTLLGGLVPTGGRTELFVRLPGQQPLRPLCLSLVASRSLPPASGRPKTRHGEASRTETTPQKGTARSKRTVEKEAVCSKETGRQFTQQTIRRSKEFRKLKTKN